MTFAPERIKELMDKYQVTEQQVIDAMTAAHEFKQFLGNQACIDQLTERLLASKTEVMAFPCKH